MSLLETSNRVPPVANRPDDQTPGTFSGSLAADLPSVGLQATPPVRSETDPRHSPVTLITWLTSLSARAAYLSALTHILVYAIAALLFWAFARHSEFSGFNRVPPLMASLADETIVDEAARMELTAELLPGDPDRVATSAQLSQALAMRPDGNVDTLPTDALNTFAGKALADVAGGTQDAFLLKLPESGLAVTKGSFTAWTDPENPMPGQNYVIIVEIRLPDDVQQYRLTDLTGEVIGTDRYRQSIPFDRDAPSASAARTPDGLKVIRGNESVQVADNRVQLVIKVPGASRLVKDTIRIRSRRLRENQELILVFGIPGQKAE